MAFSFLTLFVILFIQFTPSTLAYVSNNYRSSSWVFWSYEDGYRRCENICIIVFVISAVLLAALFVCGACLCLRSKYKKKSTKEKEEFYSKETDSMDEIYK
ncbi:11475_t:CDS:1 [Diversispora eburnea]|uniref:11475_t:CDS:1 n=1 Tax=Diversispora eburnea TaxID=1213867 RepID=A0A9N9ADI1_9GLOM|nr:11475_t:CDS:1 [Diversispora eburnea]